MGGEKSTGITEGTLGKDKEKDKEITYFVNADLQTTTEHRLTGRQILTAAGFSPVEEYRLVRDAGDKAVGLDEEVTIHKNERFTAIFDGPTPTS